LSLFLASFFVYTIYSQRGRRTAAPPARRPAPAPAARPAPRPAPPAPVAQQSHVPAQASSGGGGMLSGIGSTIVQGMAFGTGSAIAHRAVGAVAGSMSGGDAAAPAPMAAAPEYASGAMPNNNNTDTMMKQDVCVQDRQIYYDCVRDNRDDQAVCNFLLEQLKSCQQNQQMYG
jgi:coiled-coil-helix-coiled-coil-helix domain-containing protein 10